MRQAAPLAPRQPLADELAGRLRESIVTGALKPGDRLPTENALARSYGVSRAVVREAISKLKYDGLVDSRQGLGAFVGATGQGTTFRIAGGALARDDLALIFELRTTVEAEAAALAAERHGAAELAAIGAALAGIQQALDAGEDGAEADAGFHMAIARAAKNHYFDEFMTFLSARIRTSIAVARDNTARHAGWGARVQAEHAAVSEAIARRDAAAARAAMRSHLVNAAVRLGLGLAA